MDIRQQRVLQSHRRTLAWCAANPGLVPPAEGPPDAWVPITRQLATLHTFVTTSTDAAAQQIVLARQTTLEAAGEPTLRQHLRDEMHVAAQVAQALRKTVPGISIIKMPPPNAQSEGLLKEAEAFTRQAFTYETVLVEHGLAPNFIAQLRDGISALKASVDGRGAARAAQVSATKLLAVSLEQGSKFVTILDASITKALKSDSAKLAEWRNAKRVTLRGAPVTGGNTNGATPTLVTQTAASAPLTPAPATLSAAVSGSDVKAA